MENNDLVLKDMNELPESFRFLADYSPVFGASVEVISKRLIASETYLKIKDSNGMVCVLNARHFRTLAKEKLRRKILSQSMRTDHMNKLLATL